MKYLFADKNAQRLDPKYPNLNKPVRFRKPHQNMVVTRKKKKIHAKISIHCDKIRLQ